MSIEPLLGEIRIMGFNYAPQGWLQCNGQLLSISQNESLFSLLGTMYGGDGRATFGLPDLRGRTPIHFSYSHSHQQGARGGREDHVLTIKEMGNHTHRVQGSSQSPDQFRPNSAFYATSTVDDPHYSHEYPDVDSGASTLNTGGGQGHPNMQPFTTLNFCIAINGLFPTRS